jgi:hypothetical protein
MDDMRTIPEEPASDDFHTFVPSICARRFGADEQVSFDTRRRASAFHPVNYWQNRPAELKHLASVALKVLGFLPTSASVERAFPVARSVIMDHQMAMTQETVSAGVMIQVNWRVARPLLANVLAMGQAGWSQAYRELKQRKLTQRTHLPVDITGEMEAAQAPDLNTNEMRVKFISQAYLCRKSMA